MTVFHLVCKCGKSLDDYHTTYDRAKTMPCPSCGETMEIKIYPTKTHLGHTFHNPGDINSAVLEWTDVNGKKHQRDVRDQIASQKKGKSTTPGGK